MVVQKNLWGIVNVYIHVQGERNTLDARQYNKEQIFHGYGMKRSSISYFWTFFMKYVCARPGSYKHVANDESSKYDCRDDCYCIIGDIVGSALDRFS